MATPLSGAACFCPSLHRGCPALREILVARPIIGGIRRIDLGHALRERRRHRGDVARIGLDVRIAGGVHVALGAVEPRRDFQHLHVAAPPRSIRVVRLDRALLPD